MATQLVGKWVNNAAPRQSFDFCALYKIDLNAVWEILETKLDAQGETRKGQEEDENGETLQEEPKQEQIYCNNLPHHLEGWKRQKEKRWKNNLRTLV